jgi:hypothetical protein
VLNKKFDNNSVNKLLRKLKDTVPGLYTTGSLERITRERPAPAMPTESAKPMTACQYCGVLFTRPNTHENHCKRRLSAAAAAAVSAASQWSKTTVFYLFIRLFITFVCLWHPFM